MQVPGGGPRPEPPPATSEPAQPPPPLQLMVSVQGLRPVRLVEGDRVLVTLRAGSVYRDGAIRMREELEERFPGVQFTILYGPESVVVMEGGS